MDVFFFSCISDSAGPEMTQIILPLNFIIFIICALTKNPKYHINVNRRLVIINVVSKLKESSEIRNIILRKVIVI